MQVTCEERVSTELKKQIDVFFEDLKKSHPFFEKIVQGRTRPEDLSKLLVGTRYLLTQTPVHLKLALQQAREMENEFPGISRYFEHHLAEEVGHDQWATDDLTRIRNLSDRKSIDLTVAPSMVGLVRYVRNIVSTDPVLFIPYILFAEYLAVIAVPYTVESLEKYCGISRDVMSVFTRHAELDVEHASEDCRIIDDVIEKAPAYRFALKNVMSNSATMYAAFLREISEC